MAINNPYVPGDPFSYDLKWIVRKIKEHTTILSTLDQKILDTIQQLLDQHDPVYWPTADDLIHSSMITPSLAYIEGFYEAGDGGANLYFLTSDYNDVLAADFYLTLDGANRWAIPIVCTPYVTPEMFGAKGDGNEDDSDAWIHAVNYPYVIGSKTYLITRSIDLRSQQKIEGGLFFNGISESSTPYEYPSIFEISDQYDVEICNIEVVGNGSVDGAVVNKGVIQAYNSSFLNIHDNRFFDIDAGQVIRFLKCFNSSIKNNMISHYSFCGISLLQGCKNVDVVENKLYELENYTSGYTYPIGLSGYETAGTAEICENILCSGNYVENSRAWWEGIDAHGGKNLQIVNNTIKGCMCSINAVPTTSPLMPMTDLIIKGNICENGTDTSHQRTPAVQNYCIAAGGENVIISDNLLLNGGCINATAGNLSSLYLRNIINSVISGNIFRNTNNALLDIRVAENLEVCNNVSYGLHMTTPSADSYGKPSGFRMAYGALLWKNVHIHDNAFCDTDLGTASNMLLAICYNSLDTDSYIKVEDNVVDVEWAWYYGNKMVSSPCIAADIASRTFGHVGDVCWNHAPSAGQPIGWICTATWVNGAGGAWTSLGNL